MPRGRTLKKTWAATACAALLALGSSGESWQERMDSTLSALTGVNAAFAQTRQDFPDAKEGSTAESIAAVNQFKEQRSALLAEKPRTVAEPQASTGFSYKDGIIAALAALLLGAVSFPFVRPRLSKAMSRLNRALLEKAHGAKFSARGGLNDESGRVAAARLVGRSERDFDDVELNALSQDLDAQSRQVAIEVTATTVSAGPRVQSVAHPSAEAIARSPIPPSARRSDRTGMADAAHTALYTQRLDRKEPGFASKMSESDKKLVLQRRTLSDRAERMYRDLQRYYGFGSRTQLKGVLMPSLYAQLEPNLVGQDGTGIPQILSITYDVLDIKEEQGSYFARVNYDVTLMFDGGQPESSREVFTYVKENTTGALWKLLEINSAAAQASEQERLAA